MEFINVALFVLLNFMYAMSFIAAIATIYLLVTSTEKEREDFVRATVPKSSSCCEGKH